MINRDRFQGRETSARIDAVLACAEAALASFGYIKLTLPIYEYYDLLNDTVFNFSDESIIRFMDRHTGKTLVLRPDFTPQVCRIAAGLENVPFPLRVCYKGPVFRSVEKDRGVKSEEYQIGWELFGGGSLHGDLEMVCIADSVFKSINLAGYIFAFGDSLFLNRIKELASPFGEELLLAASQRRKGELEKISANTGISAELRELILRLPLSFGSADILKELRDLAAFDEVLTERLDYLDTLFNRLVSCGIAKESLIFDVAETKGMDYYTGVHFEVIHSDYGNILGGGGRYDNLMQKFGKDVSACGVALNIDALLQFPVCENGRDEFDYLVIGEANFDKSLELRNSGHKVVFLPDGSVKEKFLSYYCFKNVIE